MMHRSLLLLRKTSQALPRPSFRSVTTHKTNQVYSNAELKLGDIEVMGFDYDFTLVSYTHQVQGLVYDTAKKYLVDRLLYPSALEDTTFDSSFCIRGLVFDRKHGTLLKLSARQMITPGSVFKGRRRLPMAEVLHTYNNSLHLRQQHIKQYCRPLPDLFSLAQGCLISDVIQLAENLQIPYDPYWLHADVAKAINYAHGEGGIHATIMRDVETYVHPNPKLRPYLERLHANKKSTFLLTNSPFEFVNVGMTFLCGEDWLKLFDVSMFEASKPTFFKSKKKFRSLDSQHQFIKWGIVSDEEVSKGRGLVGGSVNEMMRLTKWHGKQIMYWGDHVFADLAEPSRQAGWHTGAIVRELDHEIDTLQSVDYVHLMEQGEMIAGELEKATRQSNAKHLDVLELKRNENFKLKSTLFNPNFGSVFLSRGQPSSFGWNVRRLSDLYTSKLSNLLNYDDDCRFYPTSSTMQHERGK